MLAALLKPGHPPCMCWDQRRCVTYIPVCPFDSGLHLIGELLQQAQATEADEPPKGRRNPHNKCGQAKFGVH